MLRQVLGTVVVVLVVNGWILIIFPLHCTSFFVIKQSVLGSAKSERKFSSEILILVFITADVSSSTKHFRDWKTEILWRFMYSGRVWFGFCVWKLGCTSLLLPYPKRWRGGNSELLTCGQVVVFWRSSDFTVRVTCKGEIWAVLVFVCN